MTQSIHLPNGMDACVDDLFVSFPHVFTAPTERAVVSMVAGMWRGWKLSRRQLTHLQQWMRHHVAERGDPKSFWLLVVITATALRLGLTVEEMFTRFDQENELAQALFDARVRIS